MPFPISSELVTFAAGRYAISPAYTGLGQDAIQNLAQAAAGLGVDRALPAMRFELDPATGAVEKGSFFHSAASVREACWDNEVPQEARPLLRDASLHRTNSHLIGFTRSNQGVLQVVLALTDPSWNRKVCHDRAAEALALFAEHTGLTQAQRQAVEALLRALPPELCGSRIAAPYATMEADGNADRAPDGTATLFLRSSASRPLHETADIDALLALEALWSHSEVLAPLAPQIRRAHDALARIPLPARMADWEVGVSLRPDGTWDAAGCVRINIRPVYSGQYAPDWRALVEKDLTDLLVAAGVGEAELQAARDLTGLHRMMFLTDDLDCAAMPVFCRIASVTLEWGDNGRNRTLLCHEFSWTGSTPQIDVPRVMAVQWHITDNCDQRCKHCYIFAEDAAATCTSTPLPELLRNLDQFRDLAKRNHRMLRIAVTGGDPIMHPQFWDFAQALHDRGVRWLILGNPFHLTPQVCQRLCDLGCVEYQLSLDGLEAFHDSLRKPGSFAATLAAVPLLAEGGVAPVCMCTVSGANVDQVVPLIDLVVQAGFDRFAFARYCPTSPQKARELHIKPARYRRLLENVLERYNHYRRAGNPVRFAEKDHLFTLLHWERGEFVVPDDARPGVVHSGCHAGQSLCVLSDGTMVGCRRMESPVAKLVDASPEEIYASPAMAAYRRVDEITACKDCELLYWCRGCVAVAAGYTGDWRSGDPQCWKDRTE